MARLDQYQQCRVSYITVLMLTCGQSKSCGKVDESSEVTEVTLSETVYRSLNNMRGIIDPFVGPFIVIPVKYEMKC